MDFPEEDLEFASLEELSEVLDGVCTNIDRLVTTFHDGRIIHEGLSLCLIGSPNVGKSSLMNALLDKERAIVSHIPGTTRDIVEDHLRINGLNFKLTDTAGIREAEDSIEIEGIRRSKAAMANSDLILLVLDASRNEIPREDQLLIESLPSGKAIIVWNKIDLVNTPPTKLPFPHIVAISAKEKYGLKELHEAIDAVVWKQGPPSKEELLVTNVRHKEALVKASDACRNVIIGLKDEISPEFLFMDMRLALSELGKIIGTNVAEDVLSSIFSQFCIGK